jgi:hypothetical protein
MFHILDHMPCKDQDESQIKKWFERHAAIGVIAAIRNIQGGIQYYELDEIVEISLKRQKRFLTQRCHAYGSGYLPNGFFFSGISTAAPTGQTHAVIPTPIITELALQQYSWMYGTKGGVYPGHRYDKKFESRARKQYEELFSALTVEMAKEFAEEFYNRSIQKVRQ